MVTRTFLDLCKRIIKGTFLAMILKMMVLLALMAVNIISCEAAITYSFERSEYVLDLTGSPLDAGVVLLRAGTAAEFAESSQVVLTTDCPPKCNTYEGAILAEEGDGADDDYEVDSKTITFGATTGTSQSQPVAITITDDDVEEHREFFCLSVQDADSRGTQWWTRVIIPWNDHCYKHESRFDGEDGTHFAAGYNIQDTDPLLVAIFGYVGPWDTSAPEPITVKITPQRTSAKVGTGPNGNAQDINIFLATQADVLEYGGTSFDFYGLHFDDEYAFFHTYGGLLSDDTWIAENALYSSRIVLNGFYDSTDFVVPNTENVYTMSYSSGRIQVRRTSPLPSKEIDETDSSSPFAIDNLFVSSAQDKYAFWEVCGTEPRKLPIVGKAASGQLSTYGPEKAVDGVIDPASCFRSEADPDTGKHWLQIDLGREFVVQKLAIFNIGYGADLDTTLADPEWLDNLQVYVGSCRPDKVYDNRVCDADIGDVAEDTKFTQAGIIEVTCNAGVFGTYVYLIPDTDTNPFQICDVRVYGTEVKPEDQTRVFFSAANSEVTVDEDVSTGEATVQITRTGSSHTCTYLEYYTYRTSTDADYDEVWPPKELEITSDTTYIPIGITDDDWCESTEDFKVVLANIEGGILGDDDTLGSSCYATVQIEDDDAPTYSLSASSTSTSEGSGPLELEVERTGEGTDQVGSADIEFIDDTATFDDYSNLDLNLAFSSTTNSVEQDVAIHDDECFEPSETFHVDLNHLTPQCSNVGSDLPLTITITDNDSQFEWDFDTDDALCLEEGDVPRTINIERVGTSQSKTVEVDINLANSAESGDFSISPSGGSVTFNTNDASEGVTITVTDDSEVEKNEWFYLTLRDPLDSDGDCPHNFGDDYKLKVKIVDNDGVYQWEQSSYIAQESDGQIEVCVHRNGDVTNSRTLQVTTIPVGATGATGSDISTVTQIVFQAGQSRSCGFIGITPDTIDESDETFTLTFNGQGINLGAVDTTSLTIQDDDDDNTVAWAQATYDFNEGIASPTVYISHTGNSAVTVSVQSTAVTATAGADFTPISLLGFTIPAQTASYPVQLQLIDDDNDEPAEIFYLTLSVISPSSATVTLSQTTITILDNGPTPTTPAPQPAGLSDAAIAGIIIGAVVGALVLAIILGVLFWLWLRGTRVPKPPVPPQFPQGQQQLVPLGLGNNAFGIPNVGQYESQYGNPTFPAQSGFLGF